MAEKFFFFTDSLNLTQTANQSYGPVPNDPDNMFSVTSKHDSSSPAKAIAVCNGYVFVVANTDNPATEVNLVLQPSQQPDIDLPSVKYYVYRGIKRSSLFNGADLAALGTNDLVDSIWESQGSRNESFDKSEGNPAGTTNDTNTPALSNSLEAIIGGSLPASTEIFKFFLKDENGDSQVPPVDAGWVLGEFTQTNIGFEIVADQIGFDPDLAYLQENKHVISVAALPGGTPTQAQRFSHWNEKEKILNFLAPSAFFGSFYLGKLYVHGIGSPKTGQSVYTDLIRQKFEDDTRIYVDIRNELEYSYDFFETYNGFDSGNLSASILINGNENEANPANFNRVSYREYNNFKWPVLTIESGDFTVASPSTELNLDLSFPKQENTNPTFVLKQGKIKQAVIQRKKRLKGTTRYLLFPNSSDFSEKVTLLIPNYNTSGIELMCSYVRICYAKQSPQCPNTSATPTELVGMYDLDNVFTPFSMIRPWGTSTNPTDEEDSWVYKNEVYVDVMRTSGQSFFANSGIARNPNGDITLFAFATDKVLGNRKTRENPFSLVGRKRKVGNTSFIQRIAKDFELTVTEIQIDANTKVEFFGNVSSPIVDTFGDYNIDDFAFVNFSQADYAVLQSIVDGTHTTYTSPPFLPGYKVHIGFQFVDASTPYGTSTNSSAGNELIEYEILLRGYATNSGTGDIEVLSINTGVRHFRLRRLITYDMMEGTTLMNALNEDDALRRPQTSGRGYNITNLGNSETIDPDPVVQNLAPGALDHSTTNVKKRAITCNIYLFRGHSVTPEEFCSYLEYFRNNIQQVWNSVNNFGLGTVYNPINNNDGTCSIGSIVRSYWIDGADIQVFEASNRHFLQIEDTEVLLLVDRPSGGGGARSHIHGEKRTGVMFYSGPAISPGSPIIPYVGGSPNEPAHEFGHVLGLSDRYCYWANVIVGDHLTPIKQAFYVDQGGSTEAYIPYHVDEEYSTRYNWRHNLMSGQTNVPNAAGSGIEAEQTFICYHLPYRPVIGGGGPGFDALSVFVTSKQLDIIMSHGTESSNYDYLFFKEENTAPYGGSMVGIYEGSEVPDGTLVDDEGYLADSMNFNDQDHRMDGRIRNNLGNIPHGIYGGGETFKGYFSPYKGLRRLGGTEPVADNNMLTDVVSGTKSTTYYELETGGNAYNSGLLARRGIRPLLLTHYGINQFRVDFLQILNTFNGISDGSITTLPPGFQQLVSRYKDIPNLWDGQNHTFTPNEFLSDKYDNHGAGNAYGRGLWNKRNDNYVNRSKFYPSSDLNTPLGSRPYGDHLFTIPYTNSYHYSPASRLQLAKSVEDFRIHYYLRFQYFYNRRKIIDIIGINGA